MDHNQVSRIYKQQLPCIYYVDHLQTGKADKVDWRRDNESQNEKLAWTRLSDAEKLHGIEIDLPL